ncbi:MAG: ATP-binding protein, partial [Planctomycetaceae bacterium]|nr:ATP-binding protein [Planctomycetaceae bacterium]
VQGLLSLGSPQLPDPVPGDLRDILPEVERLITPVCAHHRVRCKVTPPADDLPLPVADAQGLRISILNLSLNAIEAAGPNGIIKLSVDLDGRRLRVLVSDNGPGIDPDVADRLGDPFVTGKREGIGLGLTIAREVVRRLNGTLTTSRRDDETLMILSWPLPADLHSSVLAAKLQEAQT